MRTVRYNVAVSLDGFIAPPDESTSWIVDDNSVDIPALHSEFGAVVMGRKTYDTINTLAADDGFNPLRNRPKESVLVISRTLNPDEHTNVTIVKDNYIERIREIRQGEGKDIWIMGGGWLAAECLDAEVLDTIEAAIMPVVLRDGFKLLTEKRGRGSEYTLKLRKAETLEKSGILMAYYDVSYNDGGSK